MTHAEVFEALLATYLEARREIAQEYRAPTDSDTGDELAAERADWRDQWQRASPGITFGARAHG